MKRRNVDSIKPRRPLKRTKISEGIYGSSVIYIKFVLIWLLVLSADYLLDFRFEYLWPFWLLLRSVYDSFRYQGLAFSILFVCMALTADMVAIIFIPASWLFFAASTYVWVQFVWHTDKGVCAPTIVLWVVFIYVEAMVRIKEVKNVPFHLDLCRPFAAHCIGYPVVTLGFGLKSYVGYKLRQRKIQEVCIENEFYIQLLEDALPPDLQHIKNKKSSNSSQSTRLKDWDESEVEDEANAVSQSSTGSIPSTTPPPTSNNINSKGGGVLGLLSPLLLLGRLRRDGGTRQSSSSGGTSKILSLFSSLWWWKKWRRTSTAAPENIYTKNGGSQPTTTRGSNNVPTNNGSATSRPLSLNNHPPIKGAKEGSPVGNVVTNGISANHASKSLNGNSSSSKVPNNLHAELEYMQKKSVSARSVNSFDENSLEKDKSSKIGGSGALQSNSEARDTTNSEVKSNKNKASNINSNQNNVSSKLSQQNNLRSVDTNSNTTHNSKKNKNNNKENSNSSSSRDSSIPSAEDGITIIKLENELKRTRSELSSSRQSEGDLRNQVNCLMSDHKNSQQDLMQLRADNESLQSKLHSLVSGRQSDRSAMEKRLAEERRSRQSAESQLQNMERRLKKIEQENNQKQQQNKQGLASECGESCLSLRTELETEIKRMKRENRVVEERIRSLERENNVLRQESSNENKLMMSALNAMRDRNSQLEGTLSEETRVKLDLFSALGEAKRDLQISLGNLDRRDKEIEELKGKITEVLAVCPTTSFSNTHALTQITNNLSGSTCMPSFQYTTSKLLMPQVTSAVNNSLSQHSINDQLNLDSFTLNFNSLHSAPPPSISPPVAQMSSPPPNNGGNHMSGLDPNARIYTPKVVNNQPEN